MPRKYKPRDKKAEFERRPRKPSPDWEERKLRIRQAYGVKFPELTPMSVDDAVTVKAENLNNGKQTSKYHYTMSEGNRN